MSRIRVIAGLGNPGSRYCGTRHNVGFEIVDALHQRCEHGRESDLTATCWRVKKEGEEAELGMKGETFHVFKPLTFMNLSGQAVGAFLRYYKYDANELLVVHDDIDLPLGTLRIKLGGGEAGHNGLRSISENLGTKDYYRLRIGVGKPEHSEDEDAVA
ncbi:MAG: aminoacyl-tRNA hydrolase, partial [SAR324 cluster bacterium]|nr:aminoacyl-tRNA hydrolase [SAR324 cluster bacterium]